MLVRRGGFLYNRPLFFVKFLGWPFLIQEGESRPTWFDQKKAGKGTRFPRFWVQIPLFPLGPESAFFFAPLISPKPLFLCFGLIPAHFRNGAKNAKNAACRKCYYLMLVRRGGFLYNRPLHFFGPIFGLAVFEAWKHRSCWNPLFCSVFCVSRFHFCNPLKRPNRKITLFLG